MWRWLTAIARGFGEALFGWLRQKEHDRLVRHDAQTEQALAQSESARAGEREVRDAADRLRSEPGPRIPDL